MKRYAVSGILLSMFLPVAAIAQTTVHGVVLEDSVRVPIAAASVQLINRDGAVAANAITNSAGVFILRARGAGKFRLQISHISYLQLQSDTLQLYDGESILVELRMARTVIPIDPLVVTAVSTARLAGFYDRRQQGGFGKYFTRDDIKTRAGARVTDLFFGVPGLNVVSVPRGRGSAGAVNLITTRGSAMRNCMPAIFIDGIHIQQYPESGIDDFLTQNMLEAVEVYTSVAGVPPQFERGMNSCGAVAFWTRIGVERGRISTAGVALVGGVMLLMSLVAGAAGR